MLRWLAKFWNRLRNLLHFVSRVSGTVDYEQSPSRSSGNTAPLPIFFVYLFIYFFTVHLRTAIFTFLLARRIWRILRNLKSRLFQVPHYLELRPSRTFRVSSEAVGLPIIRPVRHRVRFPDARRVVLAHRPGKDFAGYRCRCRPLEGTFLLTVLQGKRAEPCVFIFSLRLISHSY